MQLSYSEFFKGFENVYYVVPDYSSEVACFRMRVSPDGEVEFVLATNARMPNECLSFKIRAFVAKSIFICIKVWGVIYYKNSETSLISSEHP